jgi:hypothetical protein
MDPNFRLSLSTTSRSPTTLSPTFADNIGPDHTLVLFRDPLTLTTANLPGPGNTRQFDLTFPFQRPFLYDPAVGNLLAEFQSGPPATTGDTIFFDLVAGDPTVNAVAAFGSSTATTGDVLGIGLITQFTVQAVPEPSTFALLGLGTLGLLGCTWRRKQLAARAEESFGKFPTSTPL